MIGYSVAQSAVLLVAATLWGVLGTACCIGQLGGVMRLVAGLGDADPIWSRIRGRYARVRTAGATPEAW